MTSKIRPAFSTSCIMQLWHADSVVVSEAVVIGVEPKEISWGLELSAELRKKVPQIIDVIVAELNTNSKGKIKC